MPGQPATRGSRSEAIITILVKATSAAYTQPVPVSISGSKMEVKYKQSDLCCVPVSQEDSDVYSVAHLSGVDIRIGHAGAASAICAAANRYLRLAGERYLTRLPKVFLSIQASGTLLRKLSDCSFRTSSVAKPHLQYIESHLKWDGESLCRGINVLGNDIRHKID